MAQGKAYFRPLHPAAEGKHRIRPAVPVSGGNFPHLRLSELLPDKSPGHVVNNPLRNEDFPFQFRIGFQRLPILFVQEMSADMNYVGKPVTVYARIDGGRHYPAMSCAA